MDREIDSSYEAEIDGLRAIAVVGVVVYHAGYTFLPGGFVGVDVFFVISGFLITRLIVTQLRSRAFSFSDFYIRRIRRLLPALMTTLLGSWLCSFVLFSPSQLERFAKAAITATLSLSNIFFYREADYFDALSIQKPLLHTWSLSVEEQFYIIWPLLLVFLAKRLTEQASIIALTIMLFLSLIVSAILVNIDRAAAFFLLPSRFFEMGVGAALVWARPKRRPPCLVGDAIALIGLALIVSSMLLLEKHHAFPGFTALWPCIGTCLILWSSGGRLIGAGLRSGPMVGIGRISYSLYLVHWPVIVFATAYVYQPLNDIQRLLVVIVSLFLAIAQFFLIEERFRRVRSGRIRPRLVAAHTISFGVLILVITTAAAVQSGWPWRIPKERQQLSDVEARRIEQERYCERPRPEHDTSLVTCQNDRHPVGEDIYLFGDSHAMHLVAGFSEAFPAHNIFVLYKSGCVPQMGLAGYGYDQVNGAATECIERNRTAIKFFASRSQATIVLTNAKRGTPELIGDATRYLAEKLRSFGHHVIVMADIIRPAITMANCYNVPSILISDAHLESRCKARSDVVKMEWAYNEALALEVSDLVRLDEIQCGKTGSKCIFMGSDGKALFRDHHHLTFNGAIHFVRKLQSSLITKAESQKKNMMQTHCESGTRQMRVACEAAE